MNELVKLVQDKTGISEDQARTAVTTVVNYLKGKLPAPIASQVDGALNSSGAMGALGGMLGGKK